VDFYNSAASGDPMCIVSNFSTASQCAAEVSMT